MVNRERFMLDFDSEGFPIADHTPFHVINIGRIPDVQEAQGLLADVRCYGCRPDEQCPRSAICEQRNPEPMKGFENPPGWNEVDGVKLPAITWADEHGGSTVEEKKAVAQWITEVREVVAMADRAMDIGAKGDLIRSMQDCASINHDGITRLSDMTAPDAYFGWKR